MRSFLTSANLAALRFFDAAARHLSFRRAAGELNVTQGAVSQQIRHLEQALGCALFDRLPRGIALTAEGERFATAVGKALAEIQSAAGELSDAKGSPVEIRLRVGPSFALRWLMPRIGDFYWKHPGISLFLVAEYGALDANHQGFDLALEMTPGSLAGFSMEPLMEEWLVPVCSRAYMRAHRVRAPGDLGGCTLLHDAHAFVGGAADAEWRYWLNEAGVGALEPQQAQYFTLANMSLEAAQSGEGVALGRTALIQELLREKKLVAPFSLNVKSPLRYCLVYRKARAGQRGMAEVMAWLREQTEAASAGDAARGQRLAGARHESDKRS